jgi:hypothetical protein
MTISTGTPIPVAIGVKPPAHPTEADSKREAPARVRVVMHTEPEGHGAWIVIVSIPGSVIIARTVNHNTTIDVGIGVPGKVPHINDLRG